MFKKTITYVDYDGNERTEDFYFHLNQSEIYKLEFASFGGLSKLIEKIIAEKDTQRLVSIFEEIVLKAYGEKSLDGKRFCKSEELVKAFTETDAYNKLFMELVNDSDFAAEFINGIMPEELRNKVAKMENKENSELVEKFKALQEKKAAENQ